MILVGIVRYHHWRSVRLISGRLFSRGLAFGLLPLFRSCYILNSHLHLFVFTSAFFKKIERQLSCFWGREIIWIQTTTMSEDKKDAEPEAVEKQSPETVTEPEKTKVVSPPAVVKHEEERSSPSKRTSPALSPVPPNGSRSHVPPIITNAVPNRPPSTTSVHSNGSAGPRSTTATSRRGGRTRSRSPPMMMNQRPPPTGPPVEPYGGVDDRRAPPSPANPSAAAAAAAAAAKSMTRNPQPPPSSWYGDSPDAREREYRRPRGGAEASRYHPRFYEGGPPPPRHRWPEEESGVRPPSRDRYPPRRPMAEDHYGYREGYSSYRGRGSRGEPYPPPYDEEYDRRYADPRYQDRRPRTTSPVPPGQPPGHEYRAREHHRYRREDPYYAQNKDVEGVRAEAGAPTSVKRTTRVIGTPTPIHMPRATEESSRSSRSGTNSIFRGRPGSDAHKPPPPGQDGDSPEKVLMSLRTPSNSFEEKSSKDATKANGDPLSPEAPPKIQHSHQRAPDSTLFFEVRIT
jgi:hypothetical protein